MLSRKRQKERRSTETEGQREEQAEKCTVIETEKNMRLEIRSELKNREEKEGRRGRE